MKRLLALVVLTSACTVQLDLGGHAAIDTTPCGQGTGCEPGRYCTNEPCDVCFCDTKHHWFCSKTCATPETGCPAAPPTDATCSGDLVCEYDTACKTVDVVKCIGGKWQWFAGGCPGPAPCPAEDEPPPLGKACPVDKLECPFKNHCGLVFTAFCDATNPWTGVPPPCPDDSCPPTPPTSGSACSVETKCAWKNVCGTTDLGACIDGTWWIGPKCGDTAECPTSAPANGTTCTTEGLPCKWDTGCNGGQVKEATCKGGQWIVSDCH